MSDKITVFFFLYHKNDELKTSQEKTGLAQDFLDYLLCDVFLWILCGLSFCSKGLEDYILKHLLIHFFCICLEKRVIPAGYISSNL